MGCVITDHFLSTDYFLLYHFLYLYCCVYIYKKKKNDISLRHACSSQYTGVKKNQETMPLIKHNSHVWLSCKQNLIMKWNYQDLEASLKEKYPVIPVDGKIAAWSLQLCVNLLFWSAIKPTSASKWLAHQQHGHMCLAIPLGKPDSGPQRLCAVKVMFICVSCIF